MNEYKTVLDKTTGQLKRVAIGTQSPAKASLSIDITDKVALRDLAMKELVAIVQANAGDIKGIAAVRELFDRSEGKAAQNITVDATLRQITVNASIEFIQPHLTIDN